MTQCEVTSRDRRSGVGADRPPRAPYGSRRLTTDLQAFDVYAIAHAALKGRPDAGGALDVAGRRLALVGGPTLEIRVERISRGGLRLLALCPGCARGAKVLYLDAPGLRCRRCARLLLPSSRNRKEDRVVPLALERVTRARQAAGADPTPGSPLPSKPRWRPWGTWEAALRRIREAEEALQRAIDAAVVRGRAETRKFAAQAAEARAVSVGASRDGGSRGLGADPCQEKSTRPAGRRARGGQGAP